MKIKDLKPGIPQSESEKDTYASIVFRNKEGKQLIIKITTIELLENTTDDFYDMLEKLSPCTSSSCNNESQNFCDCGSIYEDYEIVEVIAGAQNRLSAKPELPDLSELYLGYKQSINNLIRIQEYGQASFFQSRKNHLEELESHGIITLNAIK